MTWQGYQNAISLLVSEGTLRTEAVKIVAARYRVEFFKRHPRGAIPAWLSFPHGYRLREHYDREGHSLVTNQVVRENPSHTCQCEHTSHFDGSDVHTYGTPDAHESIRRVKTPYGTFTVCETCANTCLAKYRENPVKKEFWIHDDGRRAELYDSSYSSGYRGTGGVFTSTKVRGVHFGINNWSSREDARAFLQERGFVRENPERKAEFAERVGDFDQEKNIPGDARSWREYDSAAEYLAKRGLTGKIGDPLPAMLSMTTLRLINYDPEAFEKRVSAFAYAHSMRNVKENPSAPPQSIERAKRLYKRFTGRFSGEVRKLKLRPHPKAGVVFGELVELGYRSERDGELYRHTFRKSSRPLVVASSDGKQVLIVGGRYAFTDRGIVDR